MRSHWYDCTGTARTCHEADAERNQLILQSHYPGESRRGVSVCALAGCRVEITIVAQKCTAARCNVAGGEVGVIARAIANVR